MSNVLDLAQELISRDSQTPEDAGCQDIVVARLEKLGFSVEWMNSEPVRNLWLRKGQAKPLFVFAGHTDVVPPGPTDDWISPPFSPTVRDAKLYGRGAADMKGSIAAFVCACEAFLEQQPKHNGSIALLLTSDEEGPATQGTAQAMNILSSRGEFADWCLVGEPSSHHQLGDVIRVGRRGSLSGKLEIRGIQGHIAYPGECLNPIHAFARACAELCAQTWDRGNAHFPATSFQFSNLNSGTGADNIIPGHLYARFNFRYCTESSHESLRSRVAAILDKHATDYHLEWTHSGAPFLTSQGELIDAVCQSIHEQMGYTPQLSTGGGTSDGRFIAPTGTQVIELGPTNASIHKVNESVKISELNQLSGVYEKILARLLSS